MKRLLILSVSLIVFLTSCDKGISTAKKHFKLIESCFSNYELDDYENGEVSKIDLYACVKPYQEEFNNTKGLSQAELDSYKKEFKRLMEDSKYRVYLKAIYTMKD